VRGIIHDPQHRPIAGAEVSIAAVSSDWKQTTNTNQDGEFLITSVPLGQYRVTASGSGFGRQEQQFSLLVRQSNDAAFSVGHLRR